MRNRVVIRTGVPERDVDDFVALMREVQPLIVTTRAALLHRVRMFPEEACFLSWVAEEEDGSVIGSAHTFRNVFGNNSTAIASVSVGTRHRNRGVGSALYERVLERVRDLGSMAILATFDENPEGISFASHHGYREVRAETRSILDPRAVTDTPRAGIEIRAVVEVDPRSVYEVDIAATRDMPTTEPWATVPYETWAEDVLANPLFTPEGSFVAVVDGTVVAVSLLNRDDRGAATSMFTGTLASYRGRGLARAVKLASIAWANEHGITRLITVNDETNAPMLAVNRRLGYKPAGRRVDYIRENLG